MSTPDTRPCPKCRQPVAAGELRCPHCGATLSIATMPIEAIPPDTGAAAEPADPTDIALSVGELLPPADDLERPGLTARSFSVSTSVTTRTVGGAAGHLDAQVKIDLPQAVVDPDNRLSPPAYWKLMHRWSEALEREIEAASTAGQPLDLSQAVARVPLPFGPDCGEDLPVSLRDVMTQRARRQLAQLSRLPKPVDLFGPHAAPGIRGHDPVQAASNWDRVPVLPDRPRRGFTITCGSLLGGALLLAAGGLWLVGWILST